MMLSHSTRRSIALLAILAAVALVGCGKTPSPTELKAAGASDLVFVMEEIVAKFAAKTGNKITFSPGSSGKLAAQIREGAPFDVFFSANTGFVDQVVESGACLGETKALYARGRVVLWVPQGEAPATLADLKDPRFVKIAIANPEHAPYGLAAKQAMQKLGVWPELESRIVYGSNIKETMQFAETGNAEVAIVALSLAIRSKGAYTAIPAELHAPIDQAMVVCKGGSNEKVGRELVEFMSSPEIRALMKQYGFEQPGE